MRDMISVVLAGIGGYGNTYVSALLDAPEQRGFRLSGVVDPAPTSCRRLADLLARNIPVYPSLDAFYAADGADLCVISSPLQFHAEHTVLALSRGSHVLCEKPVCVTPEQAMRMMRARDRAGRQVAIGYQWSFSAAIQRLKADICAARFGRPRRFRTIVLWPRDEAYYKRNSWAGAKTDHKGNLVLDSPTNNACAHYLHNMLYVLGPRLDRSAQPASVTAELYRAHPIENYDTAALRCMTTDDVELLFTVSHATAEQRGPIFIYEFEHATVQFGDKPGDSITATFADRSTTDYGSPNQNTFEKLWSTIRSVRDDLPTACGIEAALAHTRCAFAAQQSMREIRAFPRACVKVDGSTGHRRTWVDGLSEMLQRCFDESKLPSERGYAWAASGVEVLIAPNAEASYDVPNQSSVGSSVAFPEYF